MKSDLSAESRASAIHLAPGQSVRSEGPSQIAGTGELVLVFDIVGPAQLEALPTQLEPPPPLERAPRSGRLEELQEQSGGRDRYLKPAGKIGGHWELCGPLLNKKPANQTGGRVDGRSDSRFITMNYLTRFHDTLQAELAGVVE